MFATPLNVRRRWSARVTSNSESGSTARGTPASTESLTAPDSGTTSSAESKRSNSSPSTELSMPPASSMSSRSPMLASKATTPARPCPAITATHRSTASSARSSASTAVPALSTRVTSRRTSLPPSASPTWSHITTRIPAPRSLRTWCVAAWNGTPHMGTLPAAPKLRPVSATPRIGDAISASRPNIS